MTAPQRLTEQSIQQCYHCHKTRAGCPVLPAMDHGPVRILRLLQLGRWEQLLPSRDIWLCARPEFVCRAVTRVPEEA